MSADPRRRDATVDDLAWILTLNNEAVPAVGLLDLGGLQALVDMAYLVRVAEIDDDPVAFLLALTGPGQPYGSANYAWLSRRLPSFAYVDRVVVAPAAFRRGVGRALYDDLGASARADGLPVIAAEVNVRPRNDQSLDFHRAYGFEPIGQADTEGGTKRVEYLVKSLDDADRFGSDGRCS